MDRRLRYPRGLRRLVIADEWNVAEDSDRLHEFARIYMYKRFDNPMPDKVLGDFEPITVHYGIRFERYLGCMGYVLYRTNRVKKQYEITARVTREDAIAECGYLEKLNAPRWMKGE